MFNFFKSAEKINKEWDGGYKAEASEKGITVKLNGREVAGADKNGRTWAEDGHEDAKESLEDAINYPG